MSEQQLQDDANAKLTSATITLEGATELMKRAESARERAIQQLIMAERESSSMCPKPWPEVPLLPCHVIDHLHGIPVLLT